MKNNLHLHMRELMNALLAEGLSEYMTNIDPQFLDYISLINPSKCNNPLCSSNTNHANSDKLFNSLRKISTDEELIFTTGYPEMMNTLKDNVTPKKILDDDCEVYLYQPIPGMFIYSRHPSSPGQEPIVMSDADVVTHNIRVYNDIFSEIKTRTTKQPSSKTDNSSFSGLFGLNDNPPKETSVPGKNSVAVIPSESKDKVVLVVTVNDKPTRVAVNKMELLKAVIKV